MTPTTTPRPPDPGGGHAADPPSAAPHTASDLGRQATAEGKAKAEELRADAAHKAETVADSVEAAARELSHGDIGHLSEYVSDIAGQLRDVAGDLREKSGDELLRDVGRLAREKPAVFLAGAVAIGFGLGRFARSSQRPHHGEREQLPIPADEATVDLAGGNTRGGIGP